MNAIHVIGPAEETDSELIEDAQAYLTYLKQQFLRAEPDQTLASAWQHFYRLYNRIIERFAMSCRVPASDLNERL
jgi:hypothetical protein